MIQNLWNNCSLSSWIVSFLLISLWNKHIKGYAKTERHAWGKFKRSVTKHSNDATDSEPVPLWSPEKQMGALHTWDYQWKSVFLTV